MRPHHAIALLSFLAHCTARADVHPPSLSAPPVVEGPAAVKDLPVQIRMLPEDIDEPELAGEPAEPEDPVVRDAQEDGEVWADRAPLPLDIDGESIREAAGGKRSIGEHARMFDRYVRGILTAEQVKAVTAACRRKNDNPFCFSYRQRKQLDKRIASRRRVYQPPPPRVLEPIVPVMKNGRAENWEELRRGEIRATIKGIVGRPMDELKALAAQGEAEKRCPNKGAVAVAATLEDSLPDASLLLTIANLYEKGAVCARRDAVDQEHYRTRAALYHVLRGDYHSAADLLKRVRPTDTYSGRAPYWLYRSHLALGETAAAERVLKRLIKVHPFSFHALLAQLSEGMDPGVARLGEKRFTKRRSRSGTVNKLIDQAEVLKRLGFDDSAALIAEWALEGRWRAEGEIRIYLAALGDAHTRVTQLPALLLAKPSYLTRQTMELLYPATFLRVMERHAGNVGVDPFLLLSLARKESAFDPKAVSIANAQGLCQLNPDTAKKLVAAINVPMPDLLDPDANAELAARYVAELFQKLDGQLHLVIASYNAGDAPVRVWGKRTPITDVMLFLDLIPYRETRDYTAAVMTNYYWYRRLYGKGMPEGLARVLPTAAAK